MQAPATFTTRNEWRVELPPEVVRDLEAKMQVLFDFWKNPRHSWEAKITVYIEWLSQMETMLSPQEMDDYLRVVAGHDGLRQWWRGLPATRDRYDEMMKAPETRRDRRRGLFGKKKERCARA